MTWFALVDCNNFFVSCERAFNPALENCPVVVLSNNDGCAISRSAEAKALNILMGDPYFKIKDFCAAHGVVICSSNFALYSDLSSRVMQILEKSAPHIEIYSVDEAFLLFPDDWCGEAVYAHCMEIRKKIKKWLGIPVSIGISKTKTLAKMANYLAKKGNGIDGVMALTPKNLMTYLTRLPVEEIWGIGRNSKVKLNGMGIFTAADFQSQEPYYIRKKMGVVGEKILWELRGVSCSAVSEKEDKKNLLYSRSFSAALTDLTQIEQAIASFTHYAAIKLRRQNSCASAMTVFIESALEGIRARTPFSASATFNVPTCDSGLLITTAKRCMRTIYQEGLRYKRCGVMLLDLVPQSTLQTDLFGNGPNLKKQRLMDTLDELNRRLGKDKVFYAAMGVERPWQGRSDKCSPAYTTDWTQLAIAKA